MQNIKKSNKLKFTVLLHRKATQRMMKVSWFIELEKKMIIKQNGIIFLSFFKVNMLLGHHNCLSVQCIDGACWIYSLSCRRLFVLPHLPLPYRTRGYLCSFPITWPPSPISGKGYTPCSRIGKYKNTPFPAPEKMGTRTRPPYYALKYVCACVCVWGGGGVFHSLRHWVTWYCHYLLFSL